MKRNMALEVTKRVLSSLLPIMYRNLKPNLQALKLVLNLKQSGQLNYSLKLFYLVEIQFYRNFFLITII